MLTEVCDYIHNYFELTAYHGNFSVNNGVIDLSGLDVAEGQRIRIIGSALNDGIYTYHSNCIHNDDDTEEVVLLSETFSGTVTSMSIPATILKIVQDISAWVVKNQAVLDSPYTSESFGGYSYTKAAGSGANSGGVLGWQDVFRSRLNAYRKIA